MAIDKNGQWLWTRFGVVAGPNVSSLRAELKAVQEALKHAEPPLRIHTDNQLVVDGFRRGRDWCVHSKTTDADLWRLIWEVMETAREKGEVEVVKVKAHRG